LEERRKRRKNYIHFTSLHPQSSSFQHPNTPTPNVNFTSSTRSFFGYICVLLFVSPDDVVFFFLLSCVVWKDFGHVKRGGSALAVAAAVKNIFNHKRFRVLQLSAEKERRKNVDENRLMAWT
jgi:hypothetical protein